MKSNIPGKKKAVGSEFFNRLAGIMGADFMKFGATLPLRLERRAARSPVMDVAGYNYGIRRYRHDLNRYPDRVDRRLGNLLLGCGAILGFWRRAIRG